MKSLFILRARLFVALILTALLSPAFAIAQVATAAKPASGLTAAEKEAAARVDVKTIREVTTALASKEMEGRGTAQAGADKAARYIADRFAKIGLKPLGDAGTYHQAIKFKIEQVEPVLSFKVGDTQLKYKEDFVVTPPFPVGPQNVSGGLAYVGYGVTSKEINRDDLAGIDLKGKLAVVMTGRPKNVDEAQWKKATNDAALVTRLVGAGATGIAFIYTGRGSQTYPLTAAYLVRRRVTLASRPQIPLNVSLLVINNNTAEKLFAGTGSTFAEVKQKTEAGEFVSRDLGKPASISVSVKREEGASSNVVGVLEGSDPQLKEQALVYTAHYDAYGIDSDGTIYPGAADNAVGVAKMIAIAEVFAKLKQKPRRSIIFIALTGEEYGLLGAEHWVRNPTWPIEKVAANINYDGIGTEVWGPLGFIIDYGFKHSDLNGVIADVTAASGVAIIPDPDPSEGVFYRSDHYAFFKKGVPSLYLIGAPSGDPLVTVQRAAKWLVTDYHMATDTIRPDWNWDGARSLAVVGLIAGLRIANRDAMPAWVESSPYNRPRGTNLPPPPAQ